MDILPPQPEETMRVARERFLGFITVAITSTKHWKRQRWTRREPKVFIAYSMGNCLEGDAAADLGNRRDVTELRDSQLALANAEAAP
jgi:hypothetical protein